MRKEKAMAEKASDKKPKSTNQKAKEKKRAGTKTAAPQPAEAAHTEKKENPPVKPVAQDHAAAGEAAKKGLLAETLENIETGARVFGEKAQGVTGALLKQLKKGLAQAYESGTKAAENIAQTARYYAEKYQHEAAVKKFRQKRDELTAELGRLIFQQFQEKGALTGAFFKEKAPSAIIEQIQGLEKEIVLFGYDLDRYGEPAKGPAEGTA